MSFWDYLDRHPWWWFWVTAWLYLVLVLVEAYFNHRKRL
jgi:hypothetical protein